MSPFVRRLLPAVAFLAVGFGVAAWTARGDAGREGGSGAGGLSTAEARGETAIPARPRPDTPAETVASDGPCHDAMETVRALVAQVPSGALLDEAQNRVLTGGLAAVDRSCSPASATAFREQEVVPWLTWAPPAAGG